MTAQCGQGEIYRLLYVSTCRIAGSDQKILAEVRKIVNISKRRNAQRSITGVLVYVNGTFIQVLEGASCDIAEAFELICSDMRHDDLRLIEHARASARLFQEWSMTLVADEHGESDGRFASSLNHLGGAIDGDPDLTVREIRALLSAGPSGLGVLHPADLPQGLASRDKELSDHRERAL